MDHKPGQLHQQRLQAEALAFVRSHRTVIEAVTDRLVAERVLSGFEVVRLVL